MFFFAVGALTELAVFMAGWASGSKFPMLGAMRAISQMVSYELPLIISALGVIMVTGSLSLPDIVEHQGGFHLGFIPAWNLFTPWGLSAGIVFYIASIAEANRCPFDLPEGESEIVAGHMTEYSGFKYALFFMGEYLGLFAISGLGITLFLGGWQAPLPGLGFVPSWLWFFAKLVVVIFVLPVDPRHLPARSNRPIDALRLAVHAADGAAHAARRGHLDIFTGDGTVFWPGWSPCRCCSFPGSSSP